MTTTHQKDRNPLRGAVRSCRRLPWTDACRVGVGAVDMCCGCSAGEPKLWRGQFIASAPMRYGRPLARRSPCDTRRLRRASGPSYQRVLHMDEQKFDSPVDSINCVPPALESMGGGEPSLTVEVRFSGSCEGGMSLMPSKYIRRCYIVHIDLCSAATLNNIHYCNHNALFDIILGHGGYSHG